MGREVEADRLELMLQPVDHRPILDQRQAEARRCRVEVAEQADLLAGAVVGGPPGMAQDQLGGGEALAPVGIERVEGAGGHQVLQLTLVEAARVGPVGEVEEVLEGAARFALGQRRGHRRRADILDRGQGIADGTAAVGQRLDAEADARAVDVGRQQADLQPLELLAEDVELVGVAEVERHRGGEELDRVVGLEIGGLVGDHGIGRRVAFVEAVAGELGDLLEDRRGLGRLDAALDRAIDEALALRFHLRLDLLAHGAPQQVGAAQAVAGQRLGDLHHLLLVDHDAEGLGQDRLQAGMQVVGLLLAGLDVDVLGNVVHRAGAVERHQRDQVLEAVGLQLAQHVAHARAFQLEHPGRLAAPDHVEGLVVVQRQVGEVDRLAALGDQLGGARQHGQRLEAEEVELHQAGQLDILHVELGDRHVGARIAVERHQLGQRAVGDHHAGGMGRGVAVESLQLHRDVDQPGDRRVLVAHLAQQRLALDRLLQADRVGRVVGDQLAQPVDQPVGHLHDAADVAQHGAGLQLAEGDDLRHPVVPVGLLHVADHLVAAVLAEIDVEIRHRYALGIEEPLEQEIETDRVEVGDGERVGDERARARAAAGPDRDALFLRPLDEIGDDEEVARIFRLLDDAKLVGEPLPVLFDSAAGRKPARLEPVLEAGLRPRAQFRRLIHRRAALPGREARQDRIVGERAEGAALGDLDRRSDGVRQVGE